MIYQIGDRDDAPPIPPLAASADPVAGREPDADFIAALEPRLKVIAGTLDEAQFLLAELRRALAQQDWPAIEAAAFRFSRTFLIDLRTAGSGLRCDLSNHRRNMLAREARDPQTEGTP